MRAPEGEGRVTVATARIDADDPNTLLLMPSAEQGPFLPFERFAETSATHDVEAGPHPHLAEEVTTYVLDGYLRHLGGGGEDADLSPGSVLVLTAHEELHHELVVQTRPQGRSAKWLSIVLRLPWHTEAPPTSLQIRDAGDAVEARDGTVQRPIVGPLARAESAMGLECTDVEFAREGTMFLRIGPDRRAVAYALRGSGMIEKEPLEPGQGALLEKLSTVAMHGARGCRIILAAVPVVRSESDVESVEGRLRGSGFSEDTSR